MVRVYRNLHKNCYSVQEKVDGRWKVVDHVATITLENPIFRVYDAGRQRVLKEKQKNVHAYVIGNRVENYEYFSIEDIVKYNPYKFGYFYNQNNEPIEKANMAKLTIPGTIFIN